MHTIFCLNVGESKKLGKEELGKFHKVGVRVTIKTTKVTSGYILLIFVFNKHHIFDHKKMRVKNSKKCKGQKSDFPSRIHLLLYPSSWIHQQFHRLLASKDRPKSGTKFQIKFNFIITVVMNTIPSQFLFVSCKICLTPSLICSLENTANQPLSMPTFIRILRLR